MRPVKLTMQAFGPYANVEIIDFSKLENRTMFVISGKTGSGKTMIFDGISYAIYGKASGDDRTGPDLRSQFAPDELITEVTLTFILRGKTYTISRSPQQEKKKERGDGHTTINAKAELTVISESGDAELLAANIRDVDEKINELMQIDSNQFRQIVMIPQGEFRKLLTSNSREKEAILQRLFRTELYKRIEDTLKYEAAILKRAVEEQIKERTQLLSSVHVQENEQLQAEFAKEEWNDKEIVRLLIEQISLIDTQLAAQEKEKQASLGVRDQLVKEQLAAEETLKQLDELKNLEIEKSKVENGKEQIITKEKEVAYARKAQQLNHQEAICIRLKKDLDTKTTTKHQLETNIVTLDSLFKKTEEKYELEKSRDTERKGKQEQLQQLQMIRADVHSYATLQSETAQLEQRVKERIEKRQKDNSLLEQKIVAIEKSQSEKTAIERGQLTYAENERILDRYVLELEKITTYETEAKKLREAKTKCTKSEEQFAHMDARYQDGKQLVDELERKWQQGQVAVLASTLQAGCACPVCGSTDHPEVALADVSEVPNELDVEAAKKDVVTLEGERAKSERTRIQIQSEVDFQKQLVSGIGEELQTLVADFSSERLDAHKEALLEKQRNLANEQALLKRDIEKLGPLTEQLHKLTEQRDTLTDELKKETELLQNDTNDHTRKQTTLERMVATIPAHVRTIASYEQVVTTTTTKLADMDKRLEAAQNELQQTREKLVSEQARLEAASKQLEDVSGELGKEREKFKTEMIAQGFDLYETYDKAKRTDEAMQTIDMEIRQYYEQLRSLTDRFHERAALLKNVARPNMDEIKEKMKEANDKIMMLETRYNHLFYEQTSNKDIVEKMNPLNEQLAKLEERYQLVGHLSDMTRGVNTSKLTFERFVLAAFLDDILIEANDRLKKMTNGRYQMLRKEERSKGNVQSGLELLVFDQYTGQERHVKTLSGGESFKASLALALGLADVVQQYAGGVSLETMFIDEGFGTLDPESLDQAIESLFDIQSSGRLVGVISHVPELKERIDARLEVITTQTGSRTEFHLSNG